MDRSKFVDWFRISLLCMALATAAVAGSARAADPKSGDPETDAAGASGKTGLPRPAGPAPLRLPEVKRLPTPIAGRGLGDALGALPEIVIARVSHPGDCAQAGEEIVIEGRGFGASQGGQDLMLRRSGLGGRTRLRVVRWSPIRIQAEIPSAPGAEAGASYVVELQDESGRWNSSGRPIRLCEARGTLQVLVQPNRDCPYEVGDVRVVAVDEGGRRTQLGPPGGGFQPRGLHEARLPLGEYRVVGELPGGGPACRERGLWGWYSNPDRAVLSESQPVGEMTLRYDRGSFVLPEGSFSGDHIGFPGRR